MNFVRIVWAWVRMNFITVIAAAVLLLALGFLARVSSGGEEFRTKLSQRDQQVQQIAGLMNQSVKIPPDRPDDPPREISRIVINNEAINALDRVYRRMNEEYANIFNLALRINQHNHLPMADGLFPDPIDNFKPYEARKRYLEAFIDMCGRYSPNSLLPRLNAGMPPNGAEIAEEMKKVEAELLLGTSLGASDGPNTSGPRVMESKEAERLRENKAYRLFALLRDRARQFHIYAERDIQKPDFPFDFGGWAYGSKAPTPAEMWEGQLGLWLQQDIVEAIARTNSVHNSEASVVFNPVKKLDRISIGALYVGIVSGGAMSMGVRDRGFVHLGALPAPPTLSPANQRLPDNFAIGPTGRRSNAIYDVHHVWIRMVMDYQRMPDFFDNLAKVNFMTVLRMDIKALDEYQTLRAGYVYGTSDCVTVEMLVESLWLRDWTSRLTPMSIRSPLGITLGTQVATPTE